jgi:Phage integrase family
VGFHTFRHSCASILFAEGLNAKQVQAWLGHSDPGFTLRTHVHLIDDGLGDADFLDATEWATPWATEATGTNAKPDPAQPLEMAG